MASNEPLFDFSLKRWPPIYRYKRESSTTESCTAEVFDTTTTTEPLTDPHQTNLTENQPNPDFAPQEQGPDPAASSSEDLSVPLMESYPIAFPVPLPELLPPISSLHQAPLAAQYFGTFQQIGRQISTPPPSQASNRQQFGLTPNYRLNAFNNSATYPPMTTTPPAIWSPAQIPAPTPSAPTPAMGGPTNSALRGDFPPLYSLPPSFWEPVIRTPERTPTPPQNNPQIPTLENLAGRLDGKGENFSDDSLKAIIIKAQPHHSTSSLAHLTRQQLVKHVDDLVAWWLQAHPQTSRSVQQADAALIQQIQAAQEHIRPPSRPSTQPQSITLPPLSATVQASAASAAAAAKAQERVIGQCPCCCENQQNAAFSPCGHLYACTRCAHRVYDGGRGKCPVCRVPIQTYLKIYATN